jgi:hypothetical protein
MRGGRLFLFAVIVAILGHGVWWYSQVSQVEKNIVENIAYFEEYWDHPIDTAQLEYTDIELGGYPFAYEVIITEPKLRVKSIAQQIEISMPVVHILQEKPGVYHFAPINEMRIVGAYGSRSFTYDIALLPMPALWLRTPAAALNQPEPPKALRNIVTRSGPPPENWPAHIVYQYAFDLPSMTMITVKSDGTSYEKGMDLPQLPYRHWRDMPVKVLRPAALAVALAEEFMARTQQ